MARRTVENFNGFAAMVVRTPAKKSTAAGRSKPTAANGQRPAATVAAKTTGRPTAAPPKPETKKKDRYAGVSARVEKSSPRNAVTGKLKVPAVDHVVRAETTKVGRDAIVTARKAETVIIGTSETGDEAPDDVSSDGQEEYDDDDFEDYESDFESDTSAVSAASRRTPDNGGPAAFALPAAVRAVDKLDTYLDERFEVELPLERTVEMGLKNFQTAGKRKREQDAKEKVRSRGAILTEMIKLDTVSYALLDLPSIPYEQYIKLYGRSNTAQIRTQTGDDNAEKEAQTNEIDTTDKWTQRPIALPNGLDCSSPEYFDAKLGAGGAAAADSRRPAGAVAVARLVRVPASPDPDRVCAVGRTMLAALEQRAMDRAEHRLTRSDREFYTTFSDGHLSPAVSAVGLLAGRPVVSAQFARITAANSSGTESLLTTHQVTTTDSCDQYVLCVWSASNADGPEYALKCPNRVTSVCTKSTGAAGFVAAAHADGSVCVWDLRENGLRQQRIDGLPCPLRSPSFNTALSVDQVHRSSVVGLCPVTYSHAGHTNDELPDEICSLDEDFGLAVWTVVDSWTTDGTEIAEHKSAGTAPWSTVRLVKTHGAEADVNVPKCLSDDAVATCACLNDDQDAFVGTSAGLVYRYNLGGHRVRPSYYASEDTGEHFSINSLDICPFDSNYFLAACSNGQVMVYRTSRREALRRFSVSSEPAPVLRAQWRTDWPGVVIGLDSLSRVHAWDILDDGVASTTSVPFPGKTVTAVSLTSSRTRRNDTYMALAFGDGTVEIHRMKSDGSADNGRDALAALDNLP